MNPDLIRMWINNAFLPVSLSLYKTQPPGCHVHNLYNTGRALVQLLFLIDLLLRQNLPSMEKRTLKFQCLVDMAKLSKLLSTGYIMNTNNFTLTGKFSDEDIRLAVNKFKAVLIETTDKVFTY